MPVHFYRKQSIALEGDYLTLTYQRYKLGLSKQNQKTIFVKICYISINNG